MKQSIVHPELLTILSESGQGESFGGDQDWYADEWRRRAGCGPTCAANVTAYLALSRPQLRSLYSGEEMRRDHFAAHMELMYQYVTPGNMGLNRLEMYTQGMEAFAASRNLSLQAHVFEVQGNMCRKRPSTFALADFIVAGLASDCPIAFLNLTNGKVRNLQGWHWITLTGAEMDDESLIVYASDEGKEIALDLRLWYLTTRMRGGLIYFTEPVPKA